MSNPTNNIGLLIGCAGSGRSGKDSFADLLTKEAQAQGAVVSRFSFAHALKTELDPFFKAFGGTAFEDGTKKKNLQRPILVAHGKEKRVISGGTYWIDKIRNDVEDALAKGHLVFVTDVRYNQHEKDEVAWVHSLGGKIIYIERILGDGQVLQPANEEELSQDGELRKDADFTLSWPTVGEKNLDSLIPMVQDIWRKINQPTNSNS